MPTPESEMFKAQKPKVPPTFDGVDYDDSKAFKAAQDAIIREQWVGAMMLRLVGQELNKCYTREGVNHLENCGHLRGNLPCPLTPSDRVRETDSVIERYLQLLKEKKVKGTLFLQQTYIDEKEREMKNAQ